MLIEINKNQAIKLCENYNVIIREGRFYSFKEYINVDRSKISYSRGKYYLYASGQNKKELLKILNFGMINGVLSSIFFCMFFMNFAILTREFVEANFYLMIISFLISFHLFLKALSRKHIDNYINSL